MEQKYQKRNALDILASSAAWDALRFLSMRLPLSFSGAALARVLSTSRSNAQRAIRRLLALGLIRGSDAGRRIRYRFNAASPYAPPFLELFAKERFRMLEPSLQNSLLVVVNDLKRELPCRMAGLFGSALSHSWNKHRDVDLCVVVNGKSLRIRTIAKKYFPDLKLDLHVYDPTAFDKKRDFVILDMLLHGIPLYGFDFYLKAKEHLESIQKDYFVNRLKKTESYAARLSHLRGPAREYYREIIEVTLGEMESILTAGRTLPKRMIRRGISIPQAIHSLHDRLAKEGDRIWLH